MALFQPYQRVSRAKVPSYVQAEIAQARADQASKSAENSARSMNMLSWATSRPLAFRRWTSWLTAPRRALAIRPGAESGVTQTRIGLEVAQTSLYWPKAGL